MSVIPALGGLSHKYSKFSTNQLPSEILSENNKSNNNKGKKEREKEISRMHSCKHVRRRGMKTEGDLSEGSKETCESDGKKWGSDISK